MTVEFNNSVYSEDEGIIFIPDAQSGSYSLKVQGTDQGEYEVVIGQISENNDIWEKINGEITQLPPSSQVDSYFLNYNNQTAFSIFPTPTITPTSIPTITPTATPTPTGSPTATPTLTPTTIPQSINSSSSTISSTNNQPTQSLISSPLLSKDTSSDVLGISSSQEELITPAIGLNKQTGAKKEIKKTSIWDYLWPTIASLILGGIGWFFKKKLIKK